MRKLWTVGLIWGLVAWVPYFANMPLLISLTLGLPVIAAGYLLVVAEMLLGTIPDVIGFCLSLPVGVILTWIIATALLRIFGGRSKKVEREVA